MSGSPSDLINEMNKWTDHIMDAILYESGTVTGRQIIQNGGRGHGKSLISNYHQQSLAALQGSGFGNHLRRDGEVQPPVDPFLYPAPGFLKMTEEEPTNTISDRHYLCLTLSEYQSFSECIQKGCYLNKEGNHCKVKNTKTKKLKNLVYKFRKSPYLHKSLIWKAQIQVIKAELERRQQWAR